MMYPFLQIDGDTEIVHSDMLPNGEVKVYIEYIEKTDAKDGFHHAACFLPAYRWENVDGFTPEEIARYQEVIESTVHLTLEFARQGGFENASAFLRSAHIGCTFGPTRATLWSQFMSMWRRAHHPPCDKSVDYKGGEVSAMQQQLPNPGPFPTEYFADH